MIGKVRILGYVYLYIVNKSDQVMIVKYNIDEGLYTVDDNIEREIDCLKDIEKDIIDKIYVWQVSKIKYDIESLHPEVVSEIDTELDKWNNDFTKWIDNRLSDDAFEVKISTDDLDRDCILRNIIEILINEASLFGYYNIEIYANFSSNNTPSDWWPINNIYDEQTSDEEICCLKDIEYLKEGFLETIIVDEEMYGSYPEINLGLSEKDWEVLNNEQCVQSKAERYYISPLENLVFALKKWDDKLEKCRCLENEYRFSNESYYSGECVDCSPTFIHNTSSRFDDINLDTDDYDSEDYENLYSEAEPINTDE